jgi:hypothetical protein
MLDTFTSSSSSSDSLPPPQITPDFLPELAYVLSLTDISPGYQQIILASVPWPRPWASFRRDIEDFGLASGDEDAFEPLHDYIDLFE